MLQLLKRKERVLKVSTFLQTMRQMQAETKEIGEYTKWKELSDGSRLSVSVTIYKITVDTRKFGGDKVNTLYCMKDSLGFEMQKVLTEDLEEIKTWLKEKGYKTTKQFYLEDCGMNEETWEEWNK